MEEVDRELMRAEEDARRDRTQSPRSPAPHRSSNEVERAVTASSVSTSSSGGSARNRGDRDGGGMNISRIPTSRELERNPTVLSRIQTAKSQHSATVGRSAHSRRPETPLPNFGGGKPLPPQLPNQEDYVVEFDGPDDPYHAQNWPTKKKCVLTPYSYEDPPPPPECLFLPGSNFYIYSD